MSMLQVMIQLQMTEWTKSAGVRCQQMIELFHKNGDNFNAARFIDGSTVRLAKVLSEGLSKTIFAFN